mmetsp:Transcript_7460/g.10456  ORF Transcript_7460/g.10456 Transcript_7460/m.10456 type:complete len:768 (+) Transcript_7460:89-2392(+)
MFKIIALFIHLLLIHVDSFHGSRKLHFKHIIYRANERSNLAPFCSFSDSSVGIVVRTPPTQNKIVIKEFPKAINTSYTFEVSLKKPLGLELMEENGGGVIISNVWPNSNAEKSGILVGDRIKATSATLGGNMWDKTTIEGVVSAITSRFVIAEEVVITLERDREKDFIDFAANEKLENEGEKPTSNETKKYIVPPLDDQTKRTVVMLHRFGDLGSVEKFPMLWNAIKKSGPPKPQVYHAAMQVLLKLGFADGTIKLYEEMRKNGVPPGLPIITTVVKAYGSAEKSGLKGAFRAFDEARRMGYSPDCVAYNALMGACIRRGKIEVAEKIFWSDMQGKMTHADLFSWNILLNAYAKAGDADKSKALVASMEAQNMEPDKITHTTLMKCLVRRNRLKEATEILQMLQAKADSEKNYKLRPDMRMFNTLIEGRLLSLNFKDVEKLIDSMKSSGLNPDLMTYSLMMDGYLRAQQPKKGLSLLAEMKDNGIPPNLHVYTTAIASAAQCGELTLALNLLQEMKSVGVRPNLRTFTAVMQACAKGGHGKIARAVFEQMKSFNISPDSIAKDTLIRALCSSKDLIGAVVTLLELEGFGNEAIESHRLLLEGNACDLSKVSEALLVDVNRGQKLPFSAYNSIIKGCVSVGEYQMAIQVLCRAFKNGYFLSEITARALSGSSFKGFRIKGASGRAEALKRIEFLLEVSKMLESERGVHGIIYQALLMDCLTAEKIDLAKELIQKREIGYYVVGREAKALAGKLEIEVQNWSKRNKASR